MSTSSNGSSESPHQPDLSPLRVVAEQAEIADAVRGVRNMAGRQLSDDDPLTPLARELARSLTEAGFTLHHCEPEHPLNRLGGVCLVPMPPEISDDFSGIAVAWSPHDLLTDDQDREEIATTTIRTMNIALSEVLEALGYSVTALGTINTWLLVRECDHEAQA